MFGTRQNFAPRRGGHVLALSVLALLALRCVPVLAQASSSAGYQYSDAPPTVTGGKPPSQSNLSGGSGSTSGIGSHAGSANSSGKKSSGGAGGSQSKSNGSAGGGNGAGQQGSQGNGSQQSLTGAGNANGSPEPGSSGGGSSPLIPILIAIVLLAGGSIAYVMIKRRRAGDPDSGDSPGSTDSAGSSVSPEAS